MARIGLSYPRTRAGLLTVILGAVLFCSGLGYLFDRIAMVRREARRSSDL